MSAGSSGIARLSDLGPRICILGPSNSGKSSLADAIGRARGLSPVHLDQLHHLPGTDWLPRPTDEFVALHDMAMRGERWVIDGNYSDLLERRLGRATGLIILDLPVAIGLARYFRRCWFEHDRKGALAGTRDRVDWAMVRYLACSQRRRAAWRGIAVQHCDLPRVTLATRGALTAFYRSEELRR